MRRILLRDLKLPLVFSLIVLAPLFYFWSQKNHEELFPVAVFVQLSFSLVIIILTVMLNEQYEDTHNGYRFYQILPLKRREVTGVKFMVPVLLIVFLAMLNRWIYSLFPVGKSALRISDSVTAVFSVMVLVICGVIYILIYILGYTRFIQLISGLIFMLVFGSFLAARFLGMDSVVLARWAEKIEHWLVSGNILPVVGAGCIVYLLLFLLAGRIEKP